MRAHHKFHNILLHRAIDNAVSIVFFFRRTYTDFVEGFHFAIKIRDSEMQMNKKWRIETCALTRHSVRMTFAQQVNCQTNKEFSYSISIPNIIYDD